MIDRINEQKCIGCALCVEICPMDVFRLGTTVDVWHTSPQGNLGRKTKAYIAYPDDCMTCFLCELKCPAGAIEVGYSPPDLPAIIATPWI